MKLGRYSTIDRLTASQKGHLILVDLNTGVTFDRFTFPRRDSSLRVPLSAKRCKQREKSLYQVL